MVPLARVSWNGIYQSDVHMHRFDVYSRLDQYQLSVVGGRVAAIGVGGLTLGGKKTILLHVS